MYEVDVAQECLDLYVRRPLQESDKPKQCPLTILSGIRDCDTKAVVEKVGSSFGGNITPLWILYARHNDPVSISRGRCPQSHSQCTSEYSCWKMFFTKEAFVSTGLDAVAIYYGKIWQPSDIDEVCSHRQTYYFVTAKKRIRNIDTNFLISFLRLSFE